MPLAQRPPAELVLGARATLGEGPVWDQRRELLWWVDIERRLVHRGHPPGGPLPPIDVPSRIGSLALRREGGLLLALEDGLWLLDSVADARPRRWARLPDAGPDRRLNDGKCDPQGRFWVGSMRHDAAEGGARLYRVDPDGTVRPMLDGVTISNGLAWSSDGATLYYVDTPTRRIDAFDFDGPSGAISNRRMVVDLSREEGSPDGMTIDADDQLWVAMWGGAAVLRCRPEVTGGSGAVIERIALPVRQPTSCTFGGQGLRDLYITSAAKGVDDAATPDGGLFRLPVDVPGRPSSRFAG